MRTRTVTTRVHSVAMLAGSATMLLSAAALADNVPPLYQLHQIGLPVNDPDNPGVARPGGGIEFTAQRYAVGVAPRVDGAPGGSDAGRDSWIWDGEQTSQLGFFSSAVFTGTNGYRNTVVQSVNASGLAYGYSIRHRNNGSFAGQSAWIWQDGQNVAVGLFGEPWEYAPNNQQSHTIAGAATDGTIVGTSVRYSIAGDAAGSNAWTWKDGTATIIGLTDSSFHVTQFGWQESRPTHVTPLGHVAGVSTRFTPFNTSIGTDTWAYRNGITTQIGLTGGEYLSTSSRQLSEIRFQNDSGQIAGRSTRYSGSQTVRGRDAWVYDGIATVRVGFDTPVHTRSDGWRDNTVDFQNQSGQVVGTTYRWFGNVAGRDAWAWSQGTLTQIGLIGGVYTTSDSIQTSVPQFQTASNVVGGTSTRYSAAGTANGEDTWVWNGSSTQQVGLTGGVFLGSNGYQRSTLTAINEQGQATGHSDRIAGQSTVNGRSAWVARDGVTTALGLSGSAYVGSAGYQYSSIWRQTESGFVLGTTSRIASTSSDRGFDAWLWDGTTTRQIGITGGIHLNSNGQRVSPDFINESGVVVGHTDRNPGSFSQYPNVSLWYYDPVADITHSLVQSVNNSNVAWGQGTLLTPDGFLFGHYYDFVDPAAAPVDVGFIFRPDIGFHDIRDLVEGGIEQFGSPELFTAIAAYGTEYLYMEGTAAGLSRDSRAPRLTFALVAIPAPSSFALFGIAAVASGRRRR